MKTVGYFWRAWCLFYYEAARQSLCERNPSHPDIPYIILRISTLKEQQK